MRNSLQTILAFLVLTASAALTAAQESATATTAHKPQTVRSDSTARTSADETFDLNIRERRITRSDFAASTSVEVGEESAQGIHLRVGIAVVAKEINVLLRDVYGHVRFRATLEPVLQRINSRRSGSTAVP